MIHLNDPPATTDGLDDRHPTSQSPSSPQELFQQQTNIERKRYLDFLTNTTYSQKDKEMWAKEYLQMERPRFTPVCLKAGGLTEDWFLDM